MADDESIAVESKPIFEDLNAEDPELQVTEISSLCVHCHDQGITRLMLTRIPHFKEVILSSFSCDHCSYKDSEVTFGGVIKEKGHRISLIVKSNRDMNRQLVKSDWASIVIPELEFEQPPSRKGEITTIEGLLGRVTTGVEQLQPARRIQYPDTAAKLDEFLQKLSELNKLKKEFTLVLDDPSGNSYIENVHAPMSDPCMKTVHYVRTHQQDVDLGLVEEGEEHCSEGEEHSSENEDFKATEESLGFPDNCPNCNAPCVTRMKVTDIPHFKEVVLMATNCEKCGYRESEVKGGAGIEDRGIRLALHVTTTNDLTRDILKSDTCAVCIPEFELELEEGTLGGKFTTVEGLLTNIRDQLSGKFTSGDSAEAESKTRMEEFIHKLDKAITGETLGYNFILDDPAGNSYMQNPFAPDLDPELKIDYYQRSYEQNELLGLNDMKTEDYD